MRRALALALVLAVALVACRPPTAGGDGEASPDEPRPAPVPGPGGPSPTTPAAAAPPPGSTPPVATPASPRPSPAPARPAGADRVPGQAGLGVTAEPCAAAVNPGNGCIYLGALEDLGQGEFARSGTASSQARRAFWQRVNDAGGIAGYDVDASTYTRDAGAGRAAAALALADVRSEVVALAAAQGSEATSSILPLLREAGMAAVTTIATSSWAGTHQVVTVGSTACVGAANGVDHVLGEGGGGVAAVHEPGAFGEDAAAGAALAAARRELPFLAAALPGADTPGATDVGAVAAAAGRVLRAEPRVVVVAAGAPALVVLAEHLVAGGFAGTVVALAPGWDERLPARLPPGAVDRLLVVGGWAPWNADTPGHAALRRALDEALGEDLAPREAHVAGWVRQYPLAAALEAAAAGGALTPLGVLYALHDLDGAGGDGMLPDAGAGPPPEAHSVVSAVDPDAPTGLSARTGHVAGPTARALDLGESCPAPR